MNIICDIDSKDIESYVSNGSDGFILYLKDYSVGSNIYFDIDEIKDIVNKYNDKDFFVSVNKNMFNSDIEGLEKVLIGLDKLNICGVLFYDMAVLEIKRRNKLELNLVWNQEHMVTNYNTCNYYYSKGVKYAYMSSEITLEEMVEIKEKSDILPLVMVVGKCNVALSRRSLITNYYKDLGKDAHNKLSVFERVSGDNYLLNEDKNGVSFTLDKVMNGCSVIKTLFENKFPYIILKEYGIENGVFLELVKDTKDYISSNCKLDNYISKYSEILGEDTGFLFKKTIYKVK